MFEVGPYRDSHVYLLTALKSLRIIAKDYGLFFLPIASNASIIHLF